MTKKEGLFYLILTGLCFLVYANSLNNAFVFDDIPAILQNPKISQPFTYLLEPPGFLNSICYLIGKNNPSIFHFISIALHSLNTILVFLFLRLFFKVESSFIAACLFAVHPIHTEAVAWVSGKPYLIISLFLLATYLLYYKSTNTSNAQRKLNTAAYLFSLILFSYFVINNFGFYSLLPLLLVLSDITFKTWKENWKYWIPFFAIAALRLITAKGAILNRAIAVSDITGVSASSTTNPVINLILAVFVHLGLLLWPARLTVFHEPVEFNMFLLVLGFVLLVSLFLSLPIILKKKKEVFFAITIYILFLAPLYSPVVFSSLVAERYLYFPSIAFCMFAAFLYERYTNNRTRARRMMAISIFLLLMCLYTARTVIRNEDWRSEESFWRSTIKVSYKSPGALNGIGLVYQKKGETQKAIESFEKAIRIHPKYASAYNNLGNVYSEIGKKEEAVKLFKKAIEVNSKYFEAYNNLGNVYSEMGMREEGITLYKKVIELNPEDQDAYYNLGNAYNEIGKKEEGISAFKRAIEVNPRDVFALNNLGAIYALSGKRKEAEKLFKKAIRIDPNYAPAHQNLNRLLKTNQE